MAGQKVLGRDKVGVGGAALDLARGEEHVCGGDEEDVVVDGGAELVEVAFEKGGEERV